MKYQNNDINPENINLTDYNIKIQKNLTFIYPKNNVLSKSQGIIYYTRNSQKYVVFGNISHAHLFDVLFKALRIPKETKFIECVVGSYKPSVSKFEWFKTKHVSFKSQKGFVIVEKILSSDSKYKKTTHLEKLIQNYIALRKVLLSNFVFKKEKEVIKKKPKKPTVSKRRI